MLPDSSSGDPALITIWTMKDPEGGRGASLKVPCRRTIVPSLSTCLMNAGVMSLTVAMYAVEKYVTGGNP